MLFYAFTVYDAVLFYKYSIVYDAYTMLSL